MIVKVKNGVIKKTNNARSIFIKYWEEIVLFFKEKGKMDKIKRCSKKIWAYLLKHDIYNILILVSPFVIMDIATRIFGSAISFYSLFKLTPRLFSCAYIVLFIGVVLNINKKYSKLLYSLFFFTFFIMFAVQNIYYSTMTNFFSFSLMALAGEGSDYFLDALKNCNVLVYIVMVILIINYIIAIKRFPKKYGYNKKRLIRVGMIFIVLHGNRRSFCHISVTTAGNGQHKKSSLSLLFAN